MKKLSTRTTPLPTAPAELTRALMDAFAGRETIGVRELAELIPMSRETIAKHITAGNLLGRLDGRAEFKHRRVFTVSDVVRFLQLTTATTIPVLRHRIALPGDQARLSSCGERSADRMREPAMSDEFAK
jgi:hypothetical protein